jgi:hypothetical protein
LFEDLLRFVKIVTSTPTYLLFRECPKKFPKFWKSRNIINPDSRHSFIKFTVVVEIKFNFPWKQTFEITLIFMLNHSMLRLDATTKKRYDGKLFKFKKFSIKQAFFINEISSSQVKVHKQKKNWSFFVLILPFFSFFF